MGRPHARSLRPRCPRYLDQRSGRRRELSEIAEDRLARLVDALTGGRIGVLDAYLDAATMLHAEYGGQEAVRIMKRAATIIEAAEAGKPVRERGRPAGTTQYCPYQLACMMLVADAPEPPPFLSKEAVQEHDAFIASVADRMPKVRGKGRRRLAFVLHTAFPGKYGASEDGIVERMKVVEPLAARMKAGDQAEWQAAWCAFESRRSV